MASWFEENIGRPLKNILSGTGGTEIKQIKSSAISESEHEEIQQMINNPEVSGERVTSTFNIVEKNGQTYQRINTGFSDILIPIANPATVITPIETAKQVDTVKTFFPNFDDSAIDVVSSTLDRFINDAFGAKKQTETLSVSQEAKVQSGETVLNYAFIGMGIFIFYLILRK